MQRPIATSAADRATKLFQELARTRKTSVDALIQAGYRLVPCHCSAPKCPGFTVERRMGDG